MANIENSHKINYWAITATIVATATAIGTFAKISYDIGKDIGGKELEQIKQLEKYDFKKLITDSKSATYDLKIASENFSELLINNKSYQEISINYEKHKKELFLEKEKNNLLKKKIDDFEKANNEYERKINELMNFEDTYILKENSAKIIPGSLINIGVGRISTTGETFANANGEKIKINAGDTFKIKGENEITCTFKIMKIEYSEITLTTDCTN